MPFDSTLDVHYEQIISDLMGVFRFKYASLDHHAGGHMNLLTSTSLGGIFILDRFHTKTSHNNK